MEPRNRTAMDEEPSLVVDTTGGIVTAVVILALIFMVILGFLACTLWIKLKRRRRDIQQARNDLEAGGHSSGRVGLTILRGESFKRVGALRTVDNERHTVLPTTNSSGSSNRASSACSSEGSLPGVITRISPYAVSRSLREGADRNAAVPSLESQLRSMNDDDYSEIDDEGHVVEPMPYLMPISSQSSVSDSEQPDEGDLGSRGMRREGWRDNGTYSQLYASLEQHYYQYESSPDEENNIFPSNGEVLSPGTTDYHLQSPCYESTLLMRLQSMNILQVDSTHVTLLRELGNGHFGKVYLGETVELSLKDLSIDDTDDDTNVSVLVAVKVLKENSPLDTQSAFVKEVKLMSGLSHHHIVNLLGVCTTGIPFMVMEYMIHGDLKHYLQKFTLSRGETTARMKLINATILIKMAAQIADGMQYLASINLVHRDLAARNCLVGANNVVKVADFGMTRGLHYSRDSNTVLPLRHIPYECFQGNFSEKSDVWSFGITVWEIFTLGKQLPYDTFNNRGLVEDALKGPKRTLLTRPQHCPEEVYALLERCCWKHRPEERLCFKQLHGMINDILNKRLDCT